MRKYIRFCVSSNVATTFWVNFGKLTLIFSANGMRIEPRLPVKTAEYRVDNIYNRNRGKNLTRFSKTFKSRGSSDSSEAFDFVAEQTCHTQTVDFPQRRSPGHSPLPPIFVPDKPPTKRGLPVCTGSVQKKQAAKRPHKPFLVTQKHLQKKSTKSNIILLPGTEPKIRLTTPTPPQSKAGE